VVGTLRPAARAVLAGTESRHGARALKVKRALPPIFEREGRGAPGQVGRMNYDDSGQTVVTELLRFMPTRLSPNTPRHGLE
jgi:hypothetical protein